MQTQVKTDAVAASARNKVRRRVIAMLHSIVVATAALIAGTVFGLSLRSSTENEIRRVRPEGDSKLFGRIFWLFAVFVFSAGLAIFILSLSGSYPLAKTDQYYFVAIWLPSIVAAKFGRYLYFARKRPNT